MILYLTAVANSSTLFSPSIDYPVIYFVPSIYEICQKGWDMYPIISQFLLFHINRRLHLNINPYVALGEFDSYCYQRCFPHGGDHGFQLRVKLTFCNVNSL